MENIGLTALAAVCLCVGGIFLGVAVVLLVQWFSTQKSTPLPLKPVSKESALLQEERYSSCWLVMTQGPKRGVTILIDRPEMRIGREIDNEIVIDHPQVSRHHAQITQDGNDFFLEDTGSSNGTYVNRNRISERFHLNNGDCIGLGGVVLLTFYH